jgi:hypothetical protein
VFGGSFGRWFIGSHHGIDAAAVTFNLVTLARLRFRERNPVLGVNNS